MKNKTSHAKNLQIRLSQCCTGKTYTIPACFSEPAFTFCDTCKTQCDVVWLPLYQEVGKGTWRKIDYSLQTF